MDSDSGDPANMKLKIRIKDVYTDYTRNTVVYNSVTREELDHHVVFLEDETYQNEYRFVFINQKIASLV